MSSIIRVLVVDDSAFMRRAITKMLTADDSIEVIGSVGDGQQAIDAVKALNPDVVTLDIEMPVMDGLTALDRIMTEMPTPVVMLSTLTQVGADASFKALEKGAFDFVPKPQDSMVEVFGADQQLREKVKAAYAAKERFVLRRKFGLTKPPAEETPLAPRPTPVRKRGAKVPEVIAIGISTGGPPALQSLFERLPAEFPVPIVVVQHMPVGFTKALADRLNKICELNIREAIDGDPLLPKTVLIAPAGKHLVIKREHGNLVARLLEDTSTHTWHKPSVDILFASLAQHVGNRALAVVMTGMGSDGTIGATAVKGQGGEVWSQDEYSSVVYGMPRSIAEAGLSDRVLDLEEIPSALAWTAKLS